MRLKARETALKRPLDEEAFRKFVVSAAVAERASALQQTLDRWRRSDLSKAASMARAYLPAASTMKAKIYPVIKPSTNSFVFDVRSDPAIFLYVDPAVGETKFQNTVAHELHHIGYGSSCPDSITQCRHLQPAGARASCSQLDWSVRRGVRHACGGRGTGGAPSRRE